MAKLLTRERFCALPIGTKVWVEWRAGTCAEEWFVIDHAQSNPAIVYMRSVILFIPYAEFDWDRQKEWRYWDAEPTLIEREEAPWR